MTALPPDDARNMREANAPKPADIGTMLARWTALHDRADELARMAQLAVEPRAKTCDRFADLTREASAWQRNLADEAISDMQAMLESGLAALKVLAERERDPCAPALTLWREFYSAREAVLTMLKAGSDNTDNQAT